MTPRIITITEEAPSDRFWDSVGAFLFDEGGLFLIVAFLCATVVVRSITAKGIET